MSCTEGLCSGVCGTASDGRWPGDSACWVCSLKAAQALCPGPHASSYSTLPGSSAAVWCLCYADKETKAPRAKSTELGFHPGPPFPGGSALCRCLGKEGALIDPCRAQARGLPQPLLSPTQSEAL